MAIMKNLALDALVDALRLELVTNVPVDDVTRAETVREGRLQDNPTKGTGINVLVYTEDEKEPDELWVKDDDIGIDSNTYTMGGGEVISSKFRLHIVCHYKGLTGDDGRKQARETTYLIIERCRKAIREMDMPVDPDTGTTRDSFGNTAILVQTTDYYMDEQGGSGHFIWRGELKLRFMIVTE
jgi:hypothetical protein